MSKDPASHFLRKRDEKKLQDRSRKTLSTEDLEIEEAELAKAREERLKDPEKYQIKAAAAAPGRNDPCPCGSGKKYKKCCGLTEK
jgi:uncharacterized protein YecA (UPF0149 family)